MLHPKQQKIKDIYGKTPETLDEIAESVIAVINEKDPVVGFAWDIKYQKMVSNSHNAPIDGYSNWSGKNTDGEGNLRGYPGFGGRVWIRYANRCKDTFGSSGNFNRSLTYTGSGGGGAYDGIWKQICSAEYQTRKLVPDLFNRNYPTVHCFSWDYRFFAQDFPGIQDTIMAAIAAHEKEEERKEIWAKLHNKYYRETPFLLPHRFKWEDPTVKAADEEFLEHYTRTQELNPT